MPHVVIDAVPDDVAECLAGRQIHLIYRCRIKRERRHEPLKSVAQRIQIFKRRTRRSVVVAVSIKASRLNATLFAGKDI